MKNNDKITMSNYLLSIKSENLGHYFMNACISPTRYVSNRNRDVQSMYENHILLSTSLAFNDSDCLLEIVLTPEENQHVVSLNKNEDCFLFNKPLPISRVRSIYFESDELMQHSIESIEINTAFLPKNASIRKFRRCKIEFKSINNADKTDYSEYLSRYNSILGGCALMRTVTKEDMNFSENYFSMLARYSDVIVKELNKNGIKVKNLYESGYYQIINNFIAKDFDERILQEIARIENQKIIKTLGSIQLDKLNNATYVAAILCDYKLKDTDLGRKNLDTLILERFSKIRDEKGEEVAFYYGYNRGYKSFSKNYGEVEFKFRLDSQLDYFTIESIYQKVFNNRKGFDFEYLDWCPRKSINRLAKIKLPNFIVLDTLVVGKKKEKVGSKEYWKFLLSDFFGENKNPMFTSFFESISNIFIKFGQYVIDDILEEKDLELEKYKEEILMLQDTISEINRNNDVKLRSELRYSQPISKVLVKDINIKAEKVQNNIAVEKELSNVETDNVKNKKRKKTDIKVANESYVNGFSEQIQSNSLKTDHIDLKSKLINRIDEIDSEIKKIDSEIASIDEQLNEINSQVKNRKNFNQAGTIDFDQFDNDKVELNSADQFRLSQRSTNIANNKKWLCEERKEIIVKLNKI